MILSLVCAVFMGSTLLGCFWKRIMAFKNSGNGFRIEVLVFCPQQLMKIQFSFDIFFS